MKTPAATAGISDAKRARSSADGLMPQWMEAQRKPAGNRGGSSKGLSVITLNYEVNPENEEPPGDHEVDENTLGEYEARAHAPVGAPGTYHKERHMLDWPTAPSFVVLIIWLSGWLYSIVVVYSPPKGPLRSAFVLFLSE